MATSLNRRNFFGFLAALIPVSKHLASEHPSISDEYRRMPIDKIRLNMAKSINPMHLAWLKKSITKYGLMYPVLVRRRPDVGYPGTKHQGYYHRVHDGQYRLIALKELGYKTVPVICIRFNPGMEKRQ